MSHFSKLDGATLVNPFTIHHADKLKDGRPFMSTCVPQAIYFDLHDVRISHAAEWQDEVKDPANPNYKLRSIIWARGETRDKITVFDMDGEIASFSEIADIIIKPLPKGHIGGSRRGTVSDGICYSGMTSRDVPENGLMEGEPGSLMYIDLQKDGYPSRIKGEHLCLEAYIDEVEFNSLMQRLSLMSAPIQQAELRVVIELFQSEVDASLSEPWYRQDYGFLIRSKDFATTRARVERLSIAYQPNVAIKPKHTIDEDGTYAPPTPYEPVSAVTLRKIEKRLKDIGITIAVGLVAIFIALISRHW
ncbi:hypothetical protein [Agrobacterium tumefaciens]|uniref:hypothetical protein n=1 Tax=Agrobacterium tumefaciens TaxID=358 RepID=UPI00220F6919|nr:hypothetical protein FY131_27040 [Agrobacterium tumefaciens]